MKIEISSSVLLIAGAALALVGESRAEPVLNPHPSSFPTPTGAAVDADAGAATGAPDDLNLRSCAGWKIQGGPESDASGRKNTNFPEASSTTYWTTKLQSTIGTTVTVHGQFPLARFTALEIYTGDQLIDHLADVSIVPDPGQNNPYVSGTVNGLYTAHVVFGPKPTTPAQNTIYTGTVTAIVLMYRIYHSTDASDPAGSTVNPVLPRVTVGGRTLVNCPVNPFLADPDSTAWGRLDNGDFIGSAPRVPLKLPVSDPPAWSISDPYSAHFFPNGADYYMSAILSRQYLLPNTDKNVYVVRFRTPTYPETRSGEPVYLDRQVHFWSFCTDEPYTTNVNRCIPDDQTVLDADGYATYVVSDRGSKPSDEALSAFNANWIAWGALYLPTDVVYDRSQKAWGINTPVHYYNALLIRQTNANPTFTQSYDNVSRLPADEQAAAMGAYWPVGGYCTTADFNAFGFACVGR